MLHLCFRKVDPEMLLPAKQLKQKLASDQAVIGIMATDHAWPLLVEICQHGGLDYLVVDSEHGDFSDELVSQICQVGRLAGFPVLVRTISCEASVVRRTVDLGPSGILIPNVESTEQLDQVQQAVWMPPRGRRRPGGMGNHWMSNFHSETWKADFEDHFIVIPQIESQQGVKNAAALASHPLVTALGLGPYDLSADLGCCWNPDDPRFIQALDTVKQVADAAHKKVWAGCDGPALRAKGYDFLWVGTVTSVLTQALTQTVADIRTVSPQPKPTQATDIPQSSPPPA